MPHTRSFVSLTDSDVGSGPTLPKFQCMPRCKGLTLLSFYGSWRNRQHISILETLENLEPYDDPVALTLLPLNIFIMEVPLISFHSIAIRIDKLLKLSLSDFAHVAELRRSHGTWTCKLVAVEDRVDTPADGDQEGSADDD